MFKERLNRMKQILSNKLVEVFSLLLLLTVSHGFSAELPGYSMNEWEKAPGVWLTGRVYSLAVGGTMLFAGTDYGIFRSSDSGKTWQPVSRSWTTGGCFLSVMGTRLFAVYGGSMWSQGDLRYTDSAFSVSADSAIPYDTLLRGPVSSISVQDSLIFTGLYRGAMVSHDSGLTWENEMFTNPWTFTTSTIVIGPYLVVGGELGIFRSSDYGAHDWTPIYNGLPDSSTLVMSLSKAGAAIFAGTNQGVYSSLDSGISWNASSSGIPDTSISALITIDSILYAGTNSGLYRSVDKGAHWNCVSSAVDSIYVECLANMGNTLFVGTSRGVFSVNLESGNWITANKGLPLRYVTKINMFGDYLFCNISDEARMYRSNDNGDTWHLCHSKIKNFIDVSTLTHVGERFFAVGPGCVWNSRDSGFTWDSIMTPFSNKVIYDIVASGGHLFVSTYYDGLWHSLDTGKTWSKVDNIPMKPQSCTVKQLGSMLFVKTDKGCYFTKDDGENWAKGDSGIGLIGQPDRKLYIFNWIRKEHSLFAITDGGTFRASDSNVVWSKVVAPSSFAIGKVNGVDYADSCWFASDGYDWAPVEMERGIFDHSVIGKDYLFAKTGGIVGHGAIWRLQLKNGGTILEKQQGELKESSLMCVYPTPFNPETKIVFSLPQISHAMLTVFDASGKQVAKLMDGTLSAGQHSVNWNGSNVASGMYVFRLKVGSRVETKRAVLMR